MIINGKKINNYEELRRETAFETSQGSDTRYQYTTKKTLPNGEIINVDHSFYPALALRLAAGKKWKDFSDNSYKQIWYNFIIALKEYRQQKREFLEWRKVGNVSQDL